MDSSNLIIGISVWFGDYPVFFILIIKYLIARYSKKHNYFCCHYMLCLLYLTETQYSSLNLKSEHCRPIYCNFEVYNVTEEVSC